MLSPADKKSRLLERRDPSPEAVEAHFRRLGSDYWNAFSPDEIAGHIATLQSLRTAAPWNVRVERLGEGLWGLTLIGGDFRGFFAAVSGFLASEGYDVRSGRAFTFPAAKAPAALAGGGVLDFLVLRHDDPARATKAEGERLRAE
ncbi:MAG TPA: hypothetical protein VHO02_02140, partial [Fibrobacteria bacterium]|nr:hypothetical protein [Fibrobacteria bacterium]